MEPGSSPKDAQIYLSLSDNEDRQEAKYNNMRRELAVCMPRLCL